jgi:hypothetical protein
VVLQFFGGQTAKSFHLTNAETGLKNSCSSGRKYYKNTTTANFDKFQMFRAIVPNHYKIRMLALVGL